MASYALYVVGFIVMIAGLAMAASLMGVAQSWIIVGIIVLAGIAILSLASSMERRDPPY
jgi:type IV secretory pathway TrbD component